MREGDHTFRPRDLVNDCRDPEDVNGLSRQPVRSTDGESLPQEREGDHTFRPRDIAPAKIMEERTIVIPQESDEMTEENGRSKDTAGASSGGVYSHRRFLSQSFWLTIFLFILGVLLVKIAFCIGDAVGLPMVLRETAILGAVICIVTIACVAVKFARLVGKLPRMEQVAKKNAKGECVEECDQAKFLHAYLTTAFENKGSLENFDCGKYAKEIIENDACLPKLEYLRRDIDDYEEWLEAFDAFEEMQDEAAKRCIRKRAVAVFVKTGVSSWKLVDCMAVLYHSLMMTTEMAKIYRRRVNSCQAFRLAVDGLFVLAIASVAQDVLEKTCEEFSSKVVTSGSKLVIGILGQVAAKTAEGTVNAALVWRLGKHMQSRFRPRVEKSKQ